MLRTTLAVVSAFGAALSLMPLQPASAQQAINLTVAAGQPLRAVPQLAMVNSYFIPEVNKRMAAAGLDKKYKINWREAYAGSLLKPTMVLEGVRDGIADIGFEPTIFHPDRLPLEQISFMAPFMSSDVQLVTRVVNRLHEEIPAFRQQYEKFGVVRLAGASNDDFALFSTFPIKRFEDIKGRRFNAAGAALQWLRGTPATPVQSNMTLYFNNTQSGVVDGFIIFLTSIPGMKYPEAAPYVTRVGFGSHYATALIMNKSVHDRLPPEVRAIIHEVAADWSEAADKMQKRNGRKSIRHRQRLCRRHSLCAAPRGTGEVGQRHAEYRPGMGRAARQAGPAGHQGAEPLYGRDAQGGREARPRLG